MTDSDVLKNRTGDMPREIWAELRGDILGYYYRGEPLNKNRATKYLLFSAHEEEMRNLRADYALVRDQNERLRQEVERYKMLAEEATRSRRQSDIEMIASMTDQLDKAEAEVERLTAREKLWREFFNIALEKTHLCTNERHKCSECKRYDKLRSELGQKEGEDG